MRELFNMTPSKIYHHICENDPNSKKGYIYIILGECGSTGKTWLCDMLKHKGYNAIEITEALAAYYLVRYTDNKNHYITDDITKQVVIVLNSPLTVNYDDYDEED